MKLAIFGSPVGHSLSPAMHRAALAHIGVDGDYETREVDHAEFLRGLTDLRDGSLHGANVTMPYKILAHDLCDTLSTQAALIGAVNTLHVGERGLIGNNTDIDGVIYAFAHAQLPDRDRVSVLGAGGAAAAALVALAGREVHVVARRPEFAQALVDRLDTGATVISWGDPVPSGVIVNATSLGMRGEMLPPAAMESATGLLDMAYGVAPTPAVLALRSRGLPVADGLDMLVGQAVGCFRIWSGEDVEPLIFQAAAEAEIRRRADGDAQC